MKDTQLYSQILGIEKPWKVTDVKVSLPEDTV
jgi:transposase